MFTLMPSDAKIPDVRDFEVPGGNEMLNFVCY
jgi:hypothetical protein